MQASNANFDRLSGWSEEDKTYFREATRIEADHPRDRDEQHTNRDRRWIAEGIKGALVALNDGDFLMAFRHYCDVEYDRGKISGYSGMSGMADAAQSIKRRIEDALQNKP